MAVGIAPRLGPRRTPGNRKKYMGRARLYLRKEADHDPAMLADATRDGIRHRVLARIGTQHQIPVLKDVDAGDVHIATALGNGYPRRRDRKLSLARLPNMRHKPTDLFKSFDPEQPRDDHGRWTGSGEQLGRLTGWGAGAVNAPRIYRVIQNKLKQPATYNFKRFSVARHAFGRPSRLGLGLLAAYGAVKVGGDVGAYVGRKIDDATASIAKRGVEETMHEFKHGKLHSGSKKGKVVTDRKQAIAIALSQAGLSDR